MVFSCTFGRHSKTVDCIHFIAKIEVSITESPLGTLKHWIEVSRPECPMGTLNSRLYCFFVKKSKTEGVTTTLKATAGSQFEPSRYTLFTILFIKNHHFSPVILKSSLKKSKLKSWEPGAQNVWTSRNFFRGHLLEGPRNISSVSQKSNSSLRWGVLSFYCQDLGYGSAKF